MSDYFRGYNKARMGVVPFLSPLPPKFISELMHNYSFEKYGNKTWKYTEKIKKSIFASKKLDEHISYLLDKKNNCSTDVNRGQVV